MKINAVCHNQLLYLFSISYCNLLYLVSRQVIELLVIFQSILMGNTCLQKQMMPAENKLINRSHHRFVRVIMEIVFLLMETVMVPVGLYW